jgi:hypothetical protein
LICAAIAALSVGFAVERGATHRIDEARDGLQVEAAGISPFGSIHPKSSGLGSSPESQSPDRAGVRVASLETDFESALDEESEPEAATNLGASFDERFFFDQRLASFDERFAGAFNAAGSASVAMAMTEERASDESPDPVEHATARPPTGRSAPRLAMLTPSAPPVFEKRRRAPDAPIDPPSLSDLGGRTAIYDIAAHTVYLPDGHRLEAHSGLGSRLDDPRYVAAKGRGPTPPNVYRLALRERLFHGVRAIRLLPVDESKMFGRDGMLAHTYMLGPNGQSNGCVSFSDYPAFLNAFLRGDVDRLVVVERLADRPRGNNTASGWLPESIKDLFRRS